jgi:hypothetical protein
LEVRILLAGTEWLEMWIIPQAEYQRQDCPGAELGLGGHWRLAKKLKKYIVEFMSFAVSLCRCVAVVNLPCIFEAVFSRKAEVFYHGDTATRRKCINGLR